MSSASQNPAPTGVRREYTDPEHLDRILSHLRRVREDIDNGRQPYADEKIATPDADAPLATTPVADAPEADASREVGLAGEAQAIPAATAEPTSAPLKAVATEKPAEAGPAPRPARGKSERLSKLVAGDMRAPEAIKPASPAAIEAAAPASILAKSKGELGRAIAASRQAFVSTGVFSFIINILMLAGPLFMLQVYDRVMASGSMPTLIALSAMTAAIYGIIGMLELVRSRIVVRIGLEVERRIADRVFEASLRKSLRQPGSSLLALRELESLRQFIAGPAPITLFDAPWTPVYLLVIFLVHWTLGVAAVIGGALLVVIAWASEIRSRAPLIEASKASARSIEIAETGQRNAEAITAMGMLGAYRGRWQAQNGQSLAWQLLAADRLASMTSVSKALRLLLQSMMLAIGAALAIKGDITAGSIIAGTIIFGRALAPVEQGVAHWRSFIKARESYAKLEGLLRDNPPTPERMSLPRPKGRLEVSALRVAAPESRTVILSGLNFTLEPGRMLAVIGPSASGKSTLARALVGLWEPFGGQIRLDNARLDQWNVEDLGRHIGYLPQDVELFSGTVRENIARFRADATDDDVVTAAKAAHAHDMIMALPQSYETELGAFGTYLSAGQRQRIGLARALFGTPALVVLDEPNSNLDRIGDEALASAIDGMRARGQAVVLVSHRVQAINKADDLLYIERGAQKAFGPRAEVIKILQAGTGQMADQASASTPAQAAQPKRAPAPAASRPDAPIRPTVVTKGPASGPASAAIAKPQPPVSPPPASRIISGGSTATPPPTTASPAQASSPKLESTPLSAPASPPAEPQPSSPAAQPDTPTIATIAEAPTAKA